MKEEREKERGMEGKEEGREKRRGNVKKLLLKNTGPRKFYGRISLKKNSFKKHNLNVIKLIQCIKRKEKFHIY